MPSLASQRSKQDVDQDQQAAPPPGPADTIGPEAAERYQQVAAQLRGQAQLARTGALAAVELARALLAEAERRAQGVEQALADLEGVAVGLDNRVHVALAGHDYAAKLDPAREQLAVLEAEHAEQARAAADLDEKLAQLRTQHTETRSAIPAARKAADVGTLAELHARDTALGDVIADLAEQRQAAVARVAALGDPGGEIGQARRAVEALERHLAGAREATAPGNLPNVWTVSMLAFLRSVHAEAFTPDRRGEIEAVLGAPELAGLYGHARRTLEARAAAGAPLDQETPNAILKGGPILRGPRTLRVQDDAQDVRATEPNGAACMFRRSGMFERGEGGVVLRVFHHAGDVR